MDAKKTESQQKRKKKKNPPSILSLPDDILMKCLAHTSRSDYRSVSLVSKSIRSLLSRPELYTSRSRIGNTEPCLYFCQKLATYDRWYALDRTLITNGRITDETSLSPIIMPSSCCAISKSTTVAVGFEIYQMGGTKWPSSAVCVLDCRTNTWRDAPNMTVARKCAKSRLIEDKIYVTGGTEEPMNWGEAFDLKTQTWKPLPSPRPSNDAIVELYNDGRILYVRSGRKNYEYEPNEGRWKETEQRWVSLLGPWCVIDNVKFTFSWACLKVMWYDSEGRNWFMVKGLEDLNVKRDTSYSAITLANYRGKLVILWDKPQPPIKFPVAGKKKTYTCVIKRIWCAVIRLEKHMGEIWGQIERSNAVLTVPDSYQVLACITL